MQWRRRLTLFCLLATSACAVPTAEPIGSAPQEEDTAVVVGFVPASETSQRNYELCKYGISGCNPSLLTDEQKYSAQAAALQRNYELCKYGISGCNPSLLTDEQKYSAQAAALQRNYELCKYGISGCNASLLTDEQKYSAQAAALQRNYELCKYGISGCSPSLLTSAEREGISSQLALRQPSVGYGCAENGSCYGDLSNATGRPKTVAVRGYYRKDGTYVRGHYRSKN